MCWVILPFLELNPALPPALLAGVPGPPCLKSVVIHTFCLAGCVVTQYMFVLNIPAPLAVFLVLYFESCTPNLPAWVAHHLRNLLFVCLHSPYRQLSLFRSLVWSLLGPAGPCCVYLFIRVVTQVCLFVCVVGCGYHNPACRLFVRVIALLATT